MSLYQFCSKITIIAGGHWEFFLNDNEECISFIVVHLSAHSLLLIHPVFNNIQISKTQNSFPSAFIVESIKYNCIKTVSD